MAEIFSPQQAMKMSANFHTNTVLSLSTLLIVSHLPHTFSQPPYQQNLEAFYPFTPPPYPASEPPTAVVSPSGRSSTRAAVGRAIGITAASTLVLSGLLFFLILWLSRRRKREKEKKGVEDGINGGTNPNPNPNLNLNPNPVVPDDNFVRVNGNLKGVIIDEDGLDVLYWKNLEDGDVGYRRSFNKKLFRSLKDEQREEEKRMVSSRGRKSKPPPPVQEAPLLRGKSSSSQSRIWNDKEDDEMIEKVPSFSDMVALKKEQSVELMRPPSSTVPPPPVAATVAGAVSKAIIAPAPAPAPPPPPVVVVGAVPKGKMAAAAAVTPPPPVMSSNGEGSSSKKNSEMKLKTIDKGSFKFDGDLMEALFGYVATNRKSPRSDGGSPIPRPENSGSPPQIFILDSRKSQDTAIVLKSLGVSRTEIIDSLVKGQGLNPETLEKLTRIAPTQEESSEILAFNGDPIRLADADSFLYHLLKAVPSAFRRFAAMLFRTNYDSEVLQIKESLHSLESACQELRTRGLFLKLLESTLKAGNRLNAGTSRGNTQAFNLTALRKLSDVKSSDGKTTLLQFVVQELVRAEGKRCVLNKTRSLSRTSSRNSNSGGQSSDPTVQNDDDREKEYMMLGLPVIGGLSSEFTNVKKAATLDYDALVKTVSALTTQMDETRRVLSECGSSDRGFASMLEGFLATAELEMQVVTEEQSRIMELVKKTRDYYQAGSSRDNGANANPLQIFVTVRDFLGMVDNVCVEIARNVQKRRSFSSSAGSPPGSPRVLRFPKLPANFMSDNSKSSSSGDSDNDTEAR